jgi:pilus assembly protein Flp/PilA
MPKSLAFLAFYGTIPNVASKLILEERSMKKHLQKFVRGLKKQSGQSLVEYALILALIAVVAILVLQGLGGKVNNTLSSVNANLP